MTEEEAWEAASARNAELGARGEADRYAVAARRPDGTWGIELTSEAPPRARWKSLREWVRRWTSLDEPLPSGRDPQTAEDAVRRLGSRKGGDRAIAAQDLARLYPEHAPDALQPLLTDDDWRVRSVAIASLGTAAGRDAWPTYAELICDPNGTVARSAWGAMRKVAGPGDIAEILDLSYTAHPSIRRAMRARAASLNGKRR